MRFTLFIVLVASCVEYEPDVGPLNAGVSTDGGTQVSPSCDIDDSDPMTDVSFTRDIRPLILRSPGGCMNCHGNGRSTSGLDVGSYTSLRRGGLVSGVRVIIDHDPCNSILPAKISSTPPFGSRMPLNGPPYFTRPEVQLVRDWIAEGANDN
jgi:hypothetical protein